MTDAAVYTVQARADEDIERLRRAIDEAREHLAAAISLRAEERLRMVSVGQQPRPDPIRAAMDAAYAALPPRFTGRRASWGGVTWLETDRRAGMLCRFVSEDGRSSMWVGPVPLNGWSWLDAPVTATAAP